MGNVKSNNVVCADCGQVLSESTGILPKESSPCPSCGSSKRRHLISIEETLTPLSSLKSIGKDANNKKFFEMFSGADWSRRVQKWIQKLRIIDKRNDYYKEEVVDPDTNERIHYDEGKLSDHVGHGSAKKSK